MQQFSITSWLDAVVNNNISQVRLLLDQGIDVNAKNEKGWTALHLAAHQGHKDIVELLIKSGANVNQKIQSCWDPQKYSRWTPLDMAIEKRHTEIAKLLLSAGADVQSAQGAPPLSLQLAVTHNHVK